jgi:hypothetical protein
MEFLNGKQLPIQAGSKAKVWEPGENRLSLNSLANY